MYLTRPGLVAVITARCSTPVILRAQTAYPGHDGGLPMTFSSLMKYPQHACLADPNHDHARMAITPVGVRPMAPA